MQSSLMPATSSKFVENSSLRHRLQSSDLGMHSYPSSDYVSSHKFSSGYKVFFAIIIVYVNPSHFSEVVSHSHWQDSMQSEIDALERNHTWSFTTLLLERKH